jgi:ATP-binding cassette subfamily C (CFTR/MRP) protein 1
MESGDLLRFNWFSVADKYCSPVAGGVWETHLENGFGAYTPCLVDSVILGVSYLFLLVIVLRRILHLRSPATSVFSVQSKWRHAFAIFLASICAVVPFLQVILGISSANTDVHGSMPIFEILVLVINGLTWAAVTFMLCLELKVYVKNLIWYVRFGAVYVVIAEISKSTYLVELREYFSQTAFGFYAAHIGVELLMVLTIVFYFPTLVPYAGYLPVSTQVEAPLPSADYQALPGDEQVFPEFKSNILSRLLFLWMTPLMRVGFKKPVTDRDVWKLDSLDQTETLYAKFKDAWERERLRQKPWLLRAINSALGKRYAFLTPYFMQVFVEWIAF